MPIRVSPILLRLRRLRCLIDWKIESCQHFHSPCRLTNVTLTALRNAGKKVRRTLYLPSCR